MSVITLPRRSLADAVAATSLGDYVEVAVTPTTLTLTGSSVETSTSVSIVAAGSAAAVVTVPTRLLAAALKSVGGDSVNVDVASAKLTLSSASARSSIAQQGRVPTLPAVPAAAWRGLTVAGALQLRDVLSAAAPAALDDGGRPAVSGVRLESDGAALMCVALDGARLHCCRSVGVELSALPAHTLPRGCVAAVCAALSLAEPPKVKVPKPKKGAAVVAVTEAPAATVRVAVGSRYVAYEVAGADSTTLVVCRRAPEPFAEWRRIAEDGGAADAVVTMPTATLLTAVRGVPADAVTLSPGPASLTLDYIITDDTGVRRLGDGTCDVECATTSFRCGAPPFSAVKVSTRYLTDALAGCGETVELRVSTGQPLRLSSGDFGAVVMFLR